MTGETTNTRAPEGGDVWRSFRRSRAGVAGLLVLALYLTAAVFADYVARDPLQTSAETFRSPGAGYLFGTDDLGRDVFSGVVHGARVALVVGVSVALLGGLVGVFVGATAAYAGGAVDDVLMRITELFLVPPRFFLALIAAALFGSTYFTLILVLAVTYWPHTARLVRAEVFSIKERKFVEAARAVGAGHARILFHEILPNALPLIITNVVLMVGGVILVAAALEFVGLGDSSRISWGYMLHNGEHFMRDAWWVLFFPALAVSLLVFALNAVGDALNRALDPRSRIEHMDKPA